MPTELAWIAVVFIAATATLLYALFSEETAAPARADVVPGSARHIVE